MSTQIKWDDAKLREEVYDTTEKRLIRAAEEVRGTCIRSMLSGSEPGEKLYYKTKKKKEHWSSPAGEPPHVDTGRLRASITWALSGGKSGKTGNRVVRPAQSGDQVNEPPKRRNEIVAVVGTNVEYAKALEFGYEPNNLAARPYLRPALERAAAKIKWLFVHE